MWRDVETVTCPDLPTANTRMQDAKKAVQAAKAPALDALNRWKLHQDHQDRSYVSTQVLPRSEYRVKYHPDGRATIQARRA